MFCNLFLNQALHNEIEKKTVAFSTIAKKLSGLLKGRLSRRSPHIQPTKQADLTKVSHMPKLTQIMVCSTSTATTEKDTSDFLKIVKMKAEDS